METLIIDALETFRAALPLTNVYIDDEEMRYTFKTEEEAQFWCVKAQKVISGQLLPLEADVALWSTGAFVFEAQLVVKFVHEMEMMPGY